MLTIYGIPGCDSCRKARRWLDEHAVEYRFHDLRADGIARDDIRRWLGHTPWERLLNTRSTTWRSRPVKSRTDLDEAGALALMLAHPTLIKRPVAESPTGMEIGFDEDRYRALAA